MAYPARATRTIDGGLHLCCGRCGEWLPERSYYRRAGGRRAQSWCKGCSVAYQRAARAARAEGEELRQSIERRRGEAPVLPSLADMLWAL